MTEAVTPPNPADPSDNTRTVPDPTLLTIDALRREIAMQESSTQKGLEALEKLVLEKFRRVGDLMERSEEQRREQKSDTKAAVDAALQSQREATHKMEKSITDQINSLRSNFETSIRGVQANVADLKDRATAQESLRAGQTEQRDESRAITGQQLGMFGAVMILVVLIVNIVLFIIAQGAL